eukprot:scaffold368360_cov50-Prasinocladus_malaysianus.AAC.2
MEGKAFKTWQIVYEAPGLAWPCGGWPPAAREGLPGRGRVEGDEALGGVVAPAALRWLAALPGLAVLSGLAVRVLVFDVGCQSDL